MNHSVNRLVVPVQGGKHQFKMYETMFNIDELRKKSIRLFIGIKSLMHPKQPLLEA